MKGLRLKLMEDSGPIIESGKMFGYGWIGIAIETPKETRDDVVVIKGEFECFEHKGPYKNLGKAYKMIMKERPAPTVFYNLYLDDPEKTNPEECRTKILFN